MLVATINLVAVEAVMTDDGGPPIMMEFEEGASVTAVAGELALLSGGRAIEAGDNPVLILGIFAEDGHNGSAGANKIRVWLADPRNIFKGNLVSGAGTQVATAITDVGLMRALVRDTTNSKVQVLNVATNGRVVILQHAKDDVIGDSGGRVLFRFLGKFAQLGSTS